MSTEQLSVIACLCILLIASGSGRFKQRARGSGGLGYADESPAPSSLVAARKLSPARVTPRPRVSAARF